MFAAAGADSCMLDERILHAGFLQLSAADGPEIKIIRTDLIGMHPFRKFAAVMDELSAAGAKRRADDGPK